MYEEVKFHNNPKDNERILTETADNIIHQKLIDFTNTHYPELRDFLNAQIAFGQAEKDIAFATDPENNFTLEDARKKLEELAEASWQYKKEMGKIRDNPALDKRHSDWHLESQKMIEEKVSELKGPIPKFVKLGDETKEIGEN